MEQRIQVLIIEDHNDDAELMILELANSGLNFAWERVDTKETFLACLSAEVDVILADYSLPQFSAPDALTLLQESGYDAPFIVVTGAISEEVAVACMKQGAADYLLKDRLSRLGSAVRHAIAQRDLRREQQQALRIRQEAEILRVELEKERELRELKSRFVSMIVHDFRTPLTTIRLSLNMLRDFYEKMSPEKRAERIRAAIEQADHLNQMIDDALIIGKMDVPGEFRPEVKDLVEVCQRIFEALRKGYIGTNHEFIFRSSSTPIWVMLDESLMQRALDNLFSNAVKYSPRGGNIRLELDVMEGNAQISLSDQGIGIPYEDQKRLFEAFRRAGNVGKIEGNGLGLAIVKQIIDLHQGTVTCHSEPSAGTTFIVALPQASTDDTNRATGLEILA